MLDMALKAIDLAMMRIIPSTVADRHRLVVLGFHSLLGSLADLDRHQIDPYQPLTLRDMDDLLTRLTATGWGFVTARDIVAAPLAGPSVWLTFDDGYANNLALPPLLHRHGARATIFVSSGQVLSGEAFWWDVLWREGRKQGTPHADLFKRREALKLLHPDAIRAAVVATYGEAALRPTDNLQRPMTPPELAALAKDPCVEIGNHTRSHAILTQVAPDVQRREIRDCQHDLHRLTGRAPIAIAYPNGAVAPGLPALARSEGLEIGLTCLPFPMPSGALEPGLGRMVLGRFGALRHGAVSRELALALAPTSLLQRRAARTARHLITSEG